MPDWDKLKEEKDENILIGRCENQAIEVMIKANANFMSKEKHEAYKELVKTLYKLNLQVEAELNNKNKSDKQKKCPKCEVLIPKTWKFHSCGWKE